MPNKLVIFVFTVGKGLKPSIYISVKSIANIDIVGQSPKLNPNNQCGSVLYSAWEYFMYLEEINHHTTFCMV